MNITGPLEITKSLKDVQRLKIAEIIEKNKSIEARKFLNSIALNKWINIQTIPFCIFYEVWELIELGYKQTIVDWEKTGVNFKVIVE